MKKPRHDAGEEPRLLRMGELAEILAVSRTKAYDLVGAGKLPAIRIGGRCLRVPLDAVRRWIERHVTNDEDGGQP